MKVVVLQQLVGKGYLIHNNIIESYKNNYYENNKGYKESQVVLKKCMKSVKNWCNKNGYDWYNVKLLGILHYLNICTLYDNFQNGEYGKFLFLYGKYLLTKHLNNA